MNWCCGGGGGVSANERADELKADRVQPQEGPIAGPGCRYPGDGLPNCRLTLEEGSRRTRWIFRLSV